jgi:hypothetical protein
MLFGVQFIVILGLSIRFGRRVSANSEFQARDTFWWVTNENARSFLVGLTISSLATFSVTLVWFAVVTKYSFAKALIQFAFLATPISMACLGLVLLIFSFTPQAEQYEDPVTIRSYAVNCWASAAGVGLFFGIVYWWCRPYISFAASNLQVALTALRDFPSLYALAMASSFCKYVWILVWTCAAIEATILLKDHGADKEMVPCGYDDDGRYLTDRDGEILMCQKPDRMPQIALFIFTLMLYWVLATIPNILHTTVAGVVGSWWDNTPHNSMSRSLRRSVTTLFGSISLGSLLVAILETLESILRNAKHKKRERQRQEADQRRHDRRYPRHQYRENDNVILDFLLSWIRRLTEYFNAWAFCFVGIYGEDFLSAGKDVTRLFRERGMTSIVSDRFVFRVIAFCRIGISLLSSLLVYAYATFLNMNTFNEETGYWSMVTGCLLGLFVSSSSVFVIECAVRAVIVCFAEKPATLQHHHPDLSQELKQGWAQAYPDEYKEAAD